MATVVMAVVIRSMFTIIITVVNLVAISTCRPANCSQAIGCSANCVKSLRKVCLEVVEKKGAASSG